MSEGSMISRMNEEELLRAVSREDLDEARAIEILKNPFCTAEIAEKLAGHHRILSTHRVRELLCKIRGMPMPRVVDLLAGLPWVSLLHLAQQPQTPPRVRRHAESRLLHSLPRMTEGEKIALARRAHRELFSELLSVGEEKVIDALLENPRMTETDLLILLQRHKIPAFFPRAIAIHRKWACRRELRSAIARCPSSPLPVAISVLAEMGMHELREILKDPRSPEKLQTAARQLMTRREEVVE